MFFVATTKVSAKVSGMVLACIRSLAAGAAIATLAFSPCGAIAHTLDSAGDVAASFQLRWTLEPWVILCMGWSIALYAAGIFRLWRRAGAGRGVGRLEAAAFCGGWLAVFIALVSPLDGIGSWLFSAHMVQHELLMIVAAPFMVLGRPLAVWIWALPATWRRAFGRAARWRWLAAFWAAMTDPVSAWSLHALALWVWHVPALFEAALASQAVHTLQHASFLATALLFWWAVLGADARKPAHGASMFYLFTTMAHTGALGALLALAPTAWYPAYAGRSAAFGLDPVEDQQLGGLVMWVPGGLAYLWAGLVVAARWLRRPAEQIRQDPGAESAAACGESMDVLRKLPLEHSLH
jgi:putative membrane protein